MDKISKEEFLAVNVMGWFFPPIGSNFQRTRYYANDKCIDSLIMVRDWKPRSNIGQAYTLLNQFKEFHIIKDNDVPEEYRFGVEVNNKKFVYGKTLAEAITEAASIASNYYE